MHLTHPANNLFAEVFLAGTATVRRSQHGSEITQSIPLCKCAASAMTRATAIPLSGRQSMGFAERVGM